MKRFLGLVLMIVLVSAPAFAGTKPQTVTFPGTVQIGSMQVPAGDYKLAWTGSGPGVQVTLTRQGKTIATFTAKVIEVKSNPGLETYAHGGAAILQTIHLNNATLQLDSAQTPGQ